MGFKTTGFLALCGSLYGGMLQANDSWGGLSTAGLFFARTDAVAMEKEELRIAPDRIDVAYVFRNITGSAATGEVIFPLPPIDVADPYHSPFVLPDTVDMTNPIGFQARINEVDIPVSLDLRALFLLHDLRDREAEANPQYEMKGEDVTDLLKSHGIPLSLDVLAIEAALRALPAEVQQQFIARDLASWENEGESVYGNWSLVLRYHWTQTFPPGEALRVSHSYRNISPGGTFMWEHAQRHEYHQDMIRQYCIDDATSRAMDRLTKSAEQTDSLSTYQGVSYILRTANNWAGSIRDFKLTIDKGRESSVVSLCAEGVKKVGPTTFEITRSDFVPDRDLEIFFMHRTERE